MIRSGLIYTGARGVGEANESEILPGGQREAIESEITVTREEEGEACGEARGEKKQVVTPGLAGIGMHDPDRAQAAPVHGDMGACPKASWCHSYCQ